MELSSCLSSVENIHKNVVCVCESQIFASRQERTLEHIFLELKVTFHCVRIYSHPKRQPLIEPSAL